MKSGLRVYVMMLSAVAGLIAICSPKFLVLHHEISHDEVPPAIILDQEIDFPLIDTALLGVPIKSASTDFGTELTVPHILINNIVNEPVAIVEQINRGLSGNATYGVVKNIDSLVAAEYHDVSHELHVPWELNDIITVIGSP